MMELESCDVCTKPTDNRKLNCPPRMADGRHFTDYRPRCALNSRSTYVIKDVRNKDPMDVKMPPNNSYDLRQYLIQNGEKLMHMNREEAFVRNMCGPCTINPSTMLPEQTMVTCDKQICRTNLNDANGLGQGRNFFTQGQERGGALDPRRMKDDPKSCCVTPEDDYEFYPINATIEEDYGRLTMPSGGKPLRASDRVR